MASIAKDKNGTRRILFVAPDDRRRTIRLGKVSQRAAEGFKTRVEQLLEAIYFNRSIDADLANWVNEQNEEIQNKLAKAGLIRQAAASRTQTLGPFLDEYLEKHGTAVKPATITSWKQCIRLLLEYFKPNTLLSEINEGKAIEWRNYLKTRDHKRIKRAQQLEETTIRKRCACARQFFEQATRLKLIPSNPFKSKRIPTSLPKGKQKAFIKPDLANLILDKLPNAQWKLLFALARWGGVRVQSEPARLKWSDIDWETNRITIHSPKTEHFEGHEKRVIPIFPELMRPLQDAWDAAEEGEPMVLPFLQHVTGAALRKPLMKAIKDAGETPWEKLWVALRATRDTELRETFPVHVVEAWLGHEDRVAKRNYTQITDEHFRVATAGEYKAAQKAAQQGRATNAQGVADPDPDQQKEPQNAAPCVTLLDDADIFSGDDRNRTCTP
jgi:integrase